jgi:hypothetical protein
MYSTVLAALLVSPAQPSTRHEDQNPLFKDLLETGVPIGTAKVKFPPPTMPDGLDGAKQMAILKQLVPNANDFAEFTRKSIVASQVVKIGDVKLDQPNTRGRSVDVWCIAYGDFKLLEDDKFLDKLTTSNKSSGAKSAELTPKDLEKRNITIPKANQGKEVYGHIEFDFLEKVRLKVTGHAMWTRNPDSVVAAAQIDPRFQDDKEFPNQWRSIIKEAGQVKLGDPNPWSSAAMYLKVTKLQEPAGAVFVEQHIIFAEPTGWFEGTNLLTSKLPIAVQENVRTLRREFQKGK